MAKAPNCRRLGTHATSAGFTLTELLVAIAILAILVALLMSALSGAKLRAQQIKCLSNLKQLALTGFMYSGENTKNPAYRDPNYQGGGAWMGTMALYDRAGNVGVCPSAPLRNPPPPAGKREVSAQQAWVRWTSDHRLMLAGSYAYNGWLYSDMKMSFGWRADPKPEFLFTTYGNIQYPSQTPVFVDSNWVDAWPLEADPPCRNLYDGEPFGLPSDNEMGRCTISRHGGRTPASAPRSVTPGAKLPGAINLGMADGHVELGKLDRLWEYYWHQNWQAPAVRPP